MLSPEQEKAEREEHFRRGQDDLDRAVEENRAERSARSDAKGREKTGGGGSRGSDPLSQVTQPPVGPEAANQVCHNCAHQANSLDEHPCKECGWTATTRTKWEQQGTAAGTPPDFVNAEDECSRCPHPGEVRTLEFCGECVDKDREPNPVSCGNCAHADGPHCETCEDCGNFEPEAKVMTGRRHGTSARKLIEEAEESPGVTSTKVAEARDSLTIFFGRCHDIRPKTDGHVQRKEQLRGAILELWAMNDAAMAHAESSIEALRDQLERLERDVETANVVLAPPTPEEAQRADAYRARARELRGRVNGMMRAHPESKELDELAARLRAFSSLSTVDALRSVERLHELEVAVIALEAGSVEALNKHYGGTVGGTESPLAEPEKEQDDMERSKKAPGENMADVVAANIRERIAELRNRVWMAQPNGREGFETANGLETELCALEQLDNATLASVGEARVDDLAARLTILEAKSDTVPAPAPTPDLSPEADPVSLEGNGRGDQEATLTVNGQRVTSEEPSPERKYFRIDQFERDLPVPLTREEVEERAARAAVLLERRDQKEADIKQESKRMKAELERMDLSLRLVTTEVRNRAVVRRVQCETEYDWERRTVTDRRTDTGEVLDQRSMTQQELQVAMDYSKREQKRHG